MENGLVVSDAIPKGSEEVELWKQFFSRAVKVWKCMPKDRLPVPCLELQFAATAEHGNPKAKAKSRHHVVGMWSSAVASGSSD